MKITQSFVLDEVDLEVVKKLAKKYDDSASAALRQIIREWARANNEKTVRIGGGDHDITDKMEIKKAEVSTFLIRKFQEWAEKEQIWNPTVTGFAEHIGIKTATLDHFMHRRRLPSKESIEQIGKLYPEIYNIMEVDPYSSLDDPLLRMLAKNWSNFTNETRDKIIDVARGNE